MLSRSFYIAMLSCLLVSTTGCSSLGVFNGIEAVPANRLPELVKGRSRNDMVEISLSRLRQRQPEHYQLGPNDILGIYIDNILGKADEPPPVQIPPIIIQGASSGLSEKDPSIGFPIPIREDGTIALPLIDPLQVGGLTLEQATNLIRRAYTVDKKLLPAGKDRIIVTISKRRTYRIQVIREEAGSVADVDKRGAGHVIDLPAYENDLMHALSMTGGLPGLDAKNEVLIIRGDSIDAAKYDAMVSQLKMCKQPCQAPPTIPDPPNMIRIPLRFFADNPPQFVEEDIILNTGDIVMIESRDREKFYTGGVLGGGEHPIPRDYDLDILGAIAIAGGPIGSSGAVLSQAGNRGGGGGQSGGGGGGGGGPMPPSEAIVLRKLPDGSQIAIRVNLNKALTDTRQRLLIQPEDVVIVRYTCTEEIINTALSLLQFNYIIGGLKK